MPSINELKKKIKGVNSTRQITKAMKMIAGMRLLRAQKKYKDANYFYEKTAALLPPLLSEPDLDPNGAGKLLKVALSENQTGKSFYLVISADRGLCGSFNSGLISKALKTINNDKNVFGAMLVGRKICDKAKSFKCSILSTMPDYFVSFDFQKSKTVSEIVFDVVNESDVSRVYIIYNTFVSLIKFKTETIQLLPFDQKPISSGVFYEYEPKIDVLCELMVEKYINAKVYKALSESYYSELAARIAAMDNATKNANGLIDTLTLEMNKVRQSNITKELADIVGSAESMR